MGMFVGRQEQLRQLDRQLELVRAGGSQHPGKALLVRGRRRVGKSRLVEEFIARSGLPSVYFTASMQRPDQELRLFTAGSAAEVKKLTAPTHVVKGLEGPKVKKTFALTDPCKGKPKYVGYELGGTGEFQVLPAKGRAIEESQCP